MGTRHLLPGISPETALREELRIIIRGRAVRKSPDRVQANRVIWGLAVAWGYRIACCKAVSEACAELTNFRDPKRT